MKFMKREWRHPIMRSLDGQKLLVDITTVKDQDMYIEPTEHWVKLNEASIKALGYTPAIGYKKGFPDIMTKVFIKFHGLQTYPCMREVEVDGKKVLIDAIGLETASTLCDWFTSNAQRDFIKSMKSSARTPIDTKKLIVFLIIGVGVALGVYFLMAGGK